PVINGADLVTSWRPYAGFVYATAISWSPYHIWQDGALLTQVANLAALSSVGEWFLDPTVPTLYVWTTNSTDPHAHMMEADRRSLSIGLIGVSNVYITGLTVNNSIGSFV